MAAHTEGNEEPNAGRLMEKMENLSSAYKHKLFEQYLQEWEVERAIFWSRIVSSAIVAGTAHGYASINPMHGKPPPFPSKRRKCSKALRELWKRYYGEPLLGEDD